MDRTVLLQDVLPSTVPAAPLCRPRLRVLVADAYADAADSLAILLGMWGYEARVARTGPAALDEMVLFRPDAALVDLVLPYLDGIRLAQRVRQLPLGEVTLIALTGLGDPQSRQRSYDAGFALHLLKPVDPRELQGILATIVKEKSVR